MSHFKQHSPLNVNAITQLVDHLQNFLRTTRLKKLTAQPEHSNLSELLEAALELLVSDRPLPLKNRDHSLTGRHKGFRDCHIKPDVVLIYSKPHKNTLWLARIGTHSELF
jgi:mRNA interferase YafQ